MPFPDASRAARRRPRRARLCRAHPRPGRRARARDGRPRPAGLRPDRLRQDRRLRPGLRAASCSASAERVGPPRAPLALAIAPTRELALQVRTELAWLYAEAGARVVACVGGTDMRAERRALDMGAHIVVGTPGRLRDHLERGSLDLSGAARRRARRGGRDARHGLPRGAGGHPRRHAGRARRTPAVLAPPSRARSRRWPSATSATRCASPPTGEGGQHGDIDYRAVAVAPRDAERALVNLLRWYDAARHRLLRDARRGRPRCTAT